MTCATPTRHDSCGQGRRRQPRKDSPMRRRRFMLAASALAAPFTGLARLRRRRRQRSARPRPAFRRRPDAAQGHVPAPRGADRMVVAYRHAARRQPRLRLRDQRGVVREGRPGLQPGHALGRRHPDPLPAHGAVLPALPVQPRDVGRIEPRQALVCAPRRPRQRPVRHRCDGRRQRLHLTPARPRHRWRRHRRARGRGGRRRARHDHPARQPWHRLHVHTDRDARRAAAERARPPRRITRTSR